ncbi:MAG: hypothetical protein M0C28_34435 [Candidatus Moduliflexus flocculans]|nr:hypothetical protein [Candidatus Moduliflexus flocculans]
MLEFVDTGDFQPEEGAILQTDFGTDSASGTAPATNGDLGQTVYRTVMTGKDLRSIAVSPGSTGHQLRHRLYPHNGRCDHLFGNHTAANVGKFLTITLDKRVVSAPRIEAAIPDGQSARSQANFNAESANALAVQLKYGSLPIPLKVVETRIIGPTLGADSLQQESGRRLDRL